MGTERSPAAAADNLVAGAGSLVVVADSPVGEDRRP